VTDIRTSQEANIGARAALICKPFAASGPPLGRGFLSALLRRFVPSETDVSLEGWLIHAAAA